MKIFLVPPNDLLRHPIPNRMYHIARRLSKKHEIYLLSYTNHPLGNRSAKRELKAVEIPISSSVSMRNLGFYYVANSLQIYSSIRHVIEREGVDVVIHANILPSFIASKLARRFGVPSVYDYLDHYPESASAYYVRGKRFVELGVSILTFWALRYSDAVVTPSYSFKKVVENVVPNKPVHVIPNGVDVELFKPLDQALARKAIGLDEEGYYLALLQGSIDAWIDIMGVVKTIAKLRKTVDIRLLVVGFSHAKHYYRLLIEYAKLHGVDKYIYTYPPQPYERMPIFINSCDFVLAPFKKMIKNFTTPLKIAEALACGVPVVTTDIAEFKFWYRQGVYTYSTYVELENVVKHLLSELDEIKSALHSYSHSFRRAFNWDNLVSRYEALIEALHG